MAEDIGSCGGSCCAPLLPEDGHIFSGIGRVGEGHTFYPFCIGHLGDYNSSLTEEGVVFCGGSCSAPSLQDGC
eukprot:1605124-Ditylum_brightwellii.AAC.1